LFCFRLRLHLVYKHLRSKGAKLLTWENIESLLKKGQPFPYEINTILIHRPSLEEFTNFPYFPLLKTNYQLKFFTFETKNDLSPLLSKKKLRETPISQSIFSTPNEKGDNSREVFPVGTVLILDLCFAFAHGNLFLGYLSASWDLIHVQNIKLFLPIKVLDKLSVIKPDLYETFGKFSKDPAGTSLMFTDHEKKREEVFQVANRFVKDFSVPFRNVAVLTENLNQKDLCKNVGFMNLPMFVMWLENQKGIFERRKMQIKEEEDK